MLFEQDIQTGVLVLVLNVFIQEQVKRSADGWSYSIEDIRSATPNIKWVISKNKKNKIKHQGDLQTDDQGRRST